MPERLPPVHIADVHLDHPYAAAGDRVGQRDAGVGVRAGVEHHPGQVALPLVHPGLLDRLDQLPLVVGLPEVQVPAELVGHLPAPLLDIGQGGGAVGLGLPYAQQVEVGAVQHQDRGHTCDLRRPST
jgi:hypothetical protein